jgi:hypothetical protein
MKIKNILMLTSIFFIILVIPIGAGYGGDDNGNAETEDHEKRLDSHGKHGTGGKEENHEGHEATGQAAAWLFLAANLTIITSLLIKGTIRLFSVKFNIRIILEEFNRLQRKYFRKWHYYLNPLAVGAALLHWALSVCPGQALPEWGLAGISLIALIGLLLKTKTTPKGLKKTAYALHTHPVFIIALLSILLSGHLMMD